MVWPVRRLNKFGAQRTDGFASKGEASLHQILSLREKAGEIKLIKCQQRVHLVCGIYWKVDFQFYTTKKNRQVWAEFKGFEDARYLLIKKLWACGFGPGELEVWKGSWQRPYLAEKIVPAKAYNGKLFRQNKIHK